MTSDRYVPALRFAALTPLYDALVVRLTREAPVKERLAAAAEVRPGMRLLDLGCGTGTLLAAIARSRNGALLSGIDADPRMLERAREKLARFDSAIELIEGRAEALPFEDSRFDRVVSSLFFHHLSPAAKVAVAREVRRVLAPAGELWIADWGPPRELASRVGFGVVRLLDGFALTRDNRTGLVPARLRAGGFADVEVMGSERTPLGTIELIRARG